MAEGSQNSPTSPGGGAAVLEKLSLVGSQRKRLDSYVGTQVKWREKDWEIKKEPGKKINAGGGTFTETPGRYYLDDPIQPNDSPVRNTNRIYVTPVEALELLNTQGLLKPQEEP